MDSGPYHLGISRAGQGLPFKYPNGTLAVQATSNMPYGHWIYFAGAQPDDEEPNGALWRGGLPAVALLQPG